MGENLDVEGRMSVRTPMQWADEPNGGFSSAAPSRLRRPLVEGRFGPMAVNVADQRRDRDSLLNWMERTIRRRRETPELGWGRFHLLDTGDDAVLGHLAQWEESSVIVLHNLSADPRNVRVEARAPAGHDRVTDLLDQGANFHELDGGYLELKLDGYGYRWFRLQPATRRTPP